MKRVAVLFVIGLFFGLALSSAMAQGVIDLPQTGQTRCYNTAGTEIACTGTGQDGEIRAGVDWPSPRFTSGVGAESECMIDNLTGLMWPKNANLPGSTRTWNEAIDYANSLTLCGHSDWRLPNVNELESLINADVSDTATWLTSQGFSNVQSDAGYWSSTTLASHTGVAWSVLMFDGATINCNKDSSADGNYVWAVRATTSGPAQVWKTGQTTSYRSGDDGDLERGVSWPNPRFSDHGNGTVTDNLTGLVWTKDANAPGPSSCGPGTDKTWQGALDYVTCLNTQNYLDHSDWRLPNRKELSSLVDWSEYAPSLPPGHPFVNVQMASYWSSTSATYAPRTDSAWLLYMWIGDVYSGSKDYEYGCVWAVRAGGSSGTLILSVSKTGTGSGTITSSPSGINCGASCSAPFSQGALVTLTPVPDSPSTFTNWSGDCTGTGACIVNMNSAKSVIAQFTGALQYTLTVTKSGTGTGTVTSSPSGISCGSTCSAPYNPGTLVTLTATPAASSTFTGWSGSGCSGTGTCTVTMNGAAAVNAAFVIITTYAVTPQAGPNGSITPNTPVQVNHGSATSFTVTPNVGYSASVTGCGGTLSGTTYTTGPITAACTVNASFATATYTVWPYAEPHGSISPNTPQIVTHGNTVSFTITPDSGYKIDTVRGCDGVLSGNAYTTGPITAACTVNASFSTAPTCTYTISPASKTFPAKGFGLSTNVTVTGTGLSTCPAPSIVEGYDWITATMGTWSRNKGTAKITVTPSTQSSVRAETVTIGGKPFTVSQTGALCSVTSLTPTSTTFRGTGSLPFSFTVTTSTADCHWRATTTQSWIDIIFGSGTGNGSVTFTVDPYTGSFPRSGSIVVQPTSGGTFSSKKTFTVKQTK